MSNKSIFSGVTQNAKGNCNISVTNIHCSSVTVTNNDPIPSMSTNDSSQPSTIQNKTAYDDLQLPFQHSIGLSIERIFEVLNLPLSTKEDKEKREKFLKNYITNDNVFEILNITYKLDNLILRDITENFITENFKEITENEKIPQISEDRLENIFKKICDKLKTIDIFITVKKWKDQNANDRRKHFCRLMRTIWNKTLEINDMKFIVIDFTDELDDCESCVNILKEIIRKQFISRTSKSHLLCLIANSETNEITNIKIFDHRKDYWHTHIDIQPNVKSPSNIIMNDTLILIGGRNMKDEITNMTFQFHIKSMKKLTMEFMNMKRMHCALSILGDNLYVIGGLNDENEIISTVEVWNSITDEWKNVRKMNINRYCHAAVTLNGKIYVFGGYDYNGEMYTWHKSIEIYDAQKNIWTYIKYDSEINKSNFDYQGKSLALPIKNKILFLDLHENENIELRIFCPYSEIVTFQSDLPKQDYCDLILLDEKIIFISYLKNYLYNLEEKTWTEFNKPVKTAGHDTTFSCSYHV